MTVASEVGAVLASHGDSYGLLDVDWLGHSFLDNGVNRLALAWSMLTSEDRLLTRQKRGELTTSRYATSQIICEWLGWT